MIIFLVGFMGSGKSTAGRKLANRLSYSFVDTDTLIVDQYGISINEIFDLLGEEKFRQAEIRVLKDLLLKQNLVVSTGGGLPCHGNNMELINKNGVSIYLKVSPATLFFRLSSRKSQRPLIRDLSDQELRSFIEEKLALREPYYNKAMYTVKGLGVDLDELLGLIRE